MRQLAVGNNLRNPDSELMENSTRILFYEGSIASVFEKDIKITIAAWHCLNVNSLIKEEFDKWYKTDEEKTFEEIFIKKTEILAKNYPIKYLELQKMILEARIKYSHMFKEIEELYRVSDETGLSRAIEINNGIPNFENRTTLIHNCPIVGIDQIDIEGINSRKELGILSSEWFGHLEKFGECRFCASFTMKKGSPFLSKPNEEKENKNKYFYGEPKIKNSISLIIDAEATELQPLIKLDYFQFIRNKISNNLSIYSEDELKLLNSLYEWNNSRDSSDLVLSNLSGSSGRDQQVAIANPDWVAILGGVSSKFVIGVISNNIDSNLIAIEAGKIFSVPVMSIYGELIQDTFELKENEK